MVDNRSVGFYGVAGSFNFKSGDTSGTAAKTQDDKMGQGTEYFAQEEDEQNVCEQNKFFVDRSSQLRASLDSLALANILTVKKRKLKKKTSKKSKKELLQLEADFEATEETG